MLYSNERLKQSFKRQEAINGQTLSKNNYQYDLQQQYDSDQTFINLTPFKENMIENYC